MSYLYIIFTLLKLLSFGLSSVLSFDYLPKPILQKELTRRPADRHPVRTATATRIPVNTAIHPCVTSTPYAGTSIK